MVFENQVRFLKRDKWLCMSRECIEWQTTLSIGIVFFLPVYTRLVIPFEKHVIVQIFL